MLKVIMKNLTRVNIILGISVILLLLTPFLMGKIKLPLLLSSFITSEYITLFTPLLILLVGYRYYDIAIFLGILHIVLTIASTKIEILKKSEGFYNDKIKIIENIKNEDDEELSFADLEEL